MRKFLVFAFAVILMAESITLGTSMIYEEIPVVEKATIEAKPRKLIVNNIHKEETQSDVSEETVPELINSRLYYTVVDHGERVTLHMDLQDHVYEMCEKYGIHGFEKVIIAKLYKESSFRPDAIHYNSNGSFDSGMAQINSTNQKRLSRDIGITDFYDPVQSIEAGVYMFSECLNANDRNIDAALVAYNTGKNGRVSGNKYSNAIQEIIKNMEEWHDWDKQKLCQ